MELRELKQEEMYLLANIPPFDVLGPPQASNCSVLAMLDEEGKVIAYWTVFAAVHVEPMWIAEHHRGNTGLVRRLWTAVLQKLKAVGCKTAFATIKYDDAMASLPPALRLGFKRYYGDLYTIEVEDAKSLEKPNANG